MTDEECMEYLFLAAKCGVTLCDVPADTFDINETGISYEENAVTRQKEIVNKLHEMGIEVLISTHLPRFYSSEEVFNIAKAQRERGTDVVKIVNISNDEKELMENLNICAELKNQIDCEYLFLEGNLQKGQTVLVHAGASGVGIAVTQIAKLFGAKVIATVRSDEKVKAIKKFGADIIVNSKETNLVELFERNSIDLVIDCVGGEFAGKCFTKMNRGGKWICIATLGGDMTQIDLKEVYKKGVRLIGSTLRSRTNEVKGQILNLLKKDIFPHVISGKVVPEIHKIFDFIDVEKAQQEMIENKNIGKILLKVAQGN